MNTVLDYLNKILKENDCIVIACSGGPDSMTMLDLLYKLSCEKKLKIICAHVNHNVRKESASEQNLVENYCLTRNILFESMTILEYKKGNFEMEARKKRYSFFENMIKKYNASYLFTAHHGDDLIETILMRLSRGSTLKGYKGIDILTKKEDYFIVRPLLFVDKKELVSYADKNNIPYAVDFTNEEDVHTRNKFRHHVLPFLKEENKNVHLQYKKFSEELKMYDEFVEQYLDKKCNHILKDNQIQIEEFLKEEQLIQNKIVEKLLNEVYDGYLEVIHKKHVQEILKLISKHQNNAKIMLPKKYIGIIEYNVFKIRKDILKENFDMILNKDLEIKHNKFVFIKEMEEKSNYVLRINTQEIALPLHVRSRKNGDKIAVKNLNGSKKVSDILTNEKICYETRKTIPIVVDANNQILWIPGVKKSKFDKEKNEKYDIIIKYISNEEEKR